MIESGVDALGQQVVEGDAVVAAGGEYNKVLGSAGTRYSLGEWEVIKVTPQGFQLREVSDAERRRHQFRRNHEVVKIRDELLGEFEYGVGIDGRVSIESMTREQAETWVKQQEDFDHSRDSGYYVIRRAHGAWVKL